MIGIKLIPKKTAITGSSIAPIIFLAYMQLTESKSGEAGEACTSPEIRGWLCQSSDMYCR